MRVAEMLPAARKVVCKLLAVKPGEEVVVIADSDTDTAMVYAIVGTLKDVGAEYSLAFIPNRAGIRNHDLTKFVDQGLEAADVVIGITTASPAGAYAKRIAQLKNAGRLRSMSMVLRDYEDWTGGAASADYDGIRDRGNRLGEIWARGKELRLTSPAGTEFHARIEGEKLEPNLGFATQAGEAAAFPDGEQSQMPTEGTAQGVIVIDGPLFRFGIPQRPLVFHVEEGRVRSIDGTGNVAERIRRLLATHRNADNVAEIGVGLNDGAEFNGRFEEEKKALGTVHVALGDNISYGGTVACTLHMDMVLYNPTLRIDSRVVLEGGKLTI
ncbi:MAG TPA: leucyl aminopeptidase [bacterium]|nr:leucyl aminopeptidase [bacterium]